MSRRVPTPKPLRAVDPAELRRLAESRVPAARRRKGGRARTSAESERLLHELEVHQLELEMQNAELRQARDEVEAALARYTDLYDFAPVGYFSLDETGTILDANLTGAAMLGAERSRIVGRKLQRFVVPSDQPVIEIFLSDVFAGTERRVCEARLRSIDGAVFWADFQGSSAARPGGKERWCRVAVSNISALKRAEDAQARLDEMAARNLELSLEIQRRHAVETSLKKSERHYARLLAESNRMQEQLRHLSRGIFHAQEDERRRISRELHDEVAQSAVGMNLHLEILSREAVGKSTARQARIATTRKLLSELLDAVHRCSRDLRPAVLDDLGLVPALKSFTRDFASRTGIQVKFAPVPAAERLSNDKRTVLYRVAQEALNNVAKHARATRAEVSMAEADGVVRLEVADDGKAFRVEGALSPGKSRRLGLLGMRERVEMVGGTFSVESAPGRGTRVRASIPLTDGGAPAADEA